MQWTMPTFSIGDTISALVLDVVDPDLFYVIPKEMKGKNQKYTIPTKMIFIDPIHKLWIYINKL